MVYLVSRCLVPPFHHISVGVILGGFDMMAPRLRFCHFGGVFSLGLIAASPISTIL
ncbi:hypothetical protein BDV98DRAFT_569395, partial [Pterulicium gracile]